MTYKEWKEALVIPIHKKGTIKTINCRGRNLLNSTNKIFSEIVQGRIEKICSKY